MEIYNDRMERIDEPDLSRGYLKLGKRTKHHAAVTGIKEQWHYEVIAEYENGGRDVTRVTDVPGVEEKAAWDEEVPIQIYVPYTQKELEALEERCRKPTPEARLTALEEENKQMKAALERLLTAQRKQMVAHDSSEQGN